MKKVYSVVGLGYGDEGKGTVVDYLAKQDPQNTLVVRHSGGHQVGHTVMVDGKYHSFHSFGSGVFRDVPTYWGENCTIFPFSFQIEFMELNVKFDIEPIFYYNPKCPITTVYDVAYNRAKDNMLGHGSVGVGFAATLIRHELVPLFAFNLKYEMVTRQKLSNIKKFYEDKCKKENMTSFYNKELDSLFKDGFHDEEFINSCNFFNDVSIEKNHKDSSFYDSYKTIIYEGNQGILLDKEHGFFPNVTYGYTGNHNTENVDEVFYVTRCYSTRHGNGPLQNEGVYMLHLKNNEKECNVHNPYQGTLRYSLLDLDYINYAIDADKIDLGNNVKTNLVVTCMDQIDEPYVTSKNGVLNLDENTFKNMVDEIYYNFSPDSETFTKNIKNGK